MGHPLGFAPEASLENLGLPLWGPGVQMVQLLELWGFWQPQLLRGVSGKGSRKYSALEGYGNQYWPIGSSILAWRTHSLTEKPGRPLSTGSQRVGQEWTNPACIHARLFLLGAALPQWELSVKVAQLLGLRGPWWHQVCRDMDCLCRRSYGPIRVFFWTSCSWPSEGLFGQSSSIALLIQVLRWLPCLGSFSVVQHIRHKEGPPWLGSYSVDQHSRLLKGHPGWGPTL